jgi:osmotically-inducible protein OsmY
VASAGEAQTALRLARETLGVANVVSKLQVRAATASRAERVRDVLVADAQLSLRELVVREQAGRVVLFGRVRTNAQRDLATRLAEKTAGGPIDNRLQLGP